MKLRKKHVDQDAPEQPDLAENARGSSWTQGRYLGAKITTGVALLAIICGPVALAAQLMSKQEPVAVQAAEEQATLDPVAQQAGEYAATYLGAWLRATRDTPNELASFIPVAAAKLPTTPTPYSDLTVASVTPDADDQSVISAVVAATLTEPAPELGEQATVQNRRYFTISVLTLDGYRVLSYPTPITAPAQAADVQLPYRNQVASNNPLAGTVTAFLAAYLTGAGEVSRYVTPTVEITAITPAPYTGVEQVSITATQAPPATPSNGETARVLAIADVLTAEGNRTQVSYPLTLTGRDGRWEVAQIDATPQIVETKPTPTPTPTTEQ